MDVLSQSWNSFSPVIAKKYLKTFGFPSEKSKRMLVDLLRKPAQKKKISILDIGCGNGQLYEYFKQEGLICDYIGVDFSQPLLAVAKKIHPESRFIVDDVNELDKVPGHYDFAIYSHVLEMLSSPEGSLIKAGQLADHLIIRFFEPPEFEASFVEIREMDVGKRRKVPYIRWRLSGDYYKLMLKKIGCKKLDIYKDKTSKDQLHVIHFDIWPHF